MKYLVVLFLVMGCSSVTRVPADSINQINEIEKKFEITESDTEETKKIKTEAKKATSMAKDVIVSESKRADAAEEKASDNEKLSNIARYLIGIGIGIAVLIVIFFLVRLGKIVLKLG